jgi:hypothetical protein
VRNDLMFLIRKAGKDLLRISHSGTIHDFSSGPDCSPLCRISQRILAIGLFGNHHRIRTRRSCVIEDAFIGCYEFVELAPGSPHRVLPTISSLDSKPHAITR